MKWIAAWLVLSSSWALHAQTDMYAAKFYAVLSHAHSELTIEIPTEAIEPSIKSHFPYLREKQLSERELNAYLEMYLRNTVKLQYGAFPMALGDSGITHKDGFTYLTIRLAGVPKEAKEMMVEINSFASHSKHQNVLHINDWKRSDRIVELNSYNRYTANIAL